MHEHDQDLIMALAEGSLDETAAAAARTEIGACAECSRDLELQRLAISALDGLPEVYLTASESSRLHADLERELGLHQAPSRRRTGLAWGRWLPAVGIAAVFLVAIVSLSFLMGRGGDSASETTAVALDMTTTTAAAETTAAAAAPREAADGDAVAEMMGSEETNGGATATTEAMQSMETTTTASAEESTTTNSGLKTVFDMLPFRGMIDALDNQALIDEIAADRGLLEEMSLAAREVDATVDECVISNSAPDMAGVLGLPESSEPILLGVVGDAETGEELLLVAYVPEDIEQTVFVTQRNHSCDIVATLFQ